MNKTLKTVWNWVSGILVGLVVLMAVALVGVRIVGLKPFVVLSGSMEPKYHVKLKKLYDGFYTEEAKNIAQKRRVFLKNFYDELLEEVSL